MDAAAHLADSGLVVFDRVNQTLVVESRPTQLSPKAFAVLAHLYDRPRQLVTKDELLRSAWPDVYVVDGVLKNAVREIRGVLADDPRAPRYVETVHRRGYRFVGEHLLVCSTGRPTAAPAPASATIGTGAFVGRERELGVLDEAWRETCSGACRAVVVGGHPGIGRSTFVAEWLARTVPAGSETLAVKVRCQPTEDERPYLVLLDALSRLCRGPHGAKVRRALAREAPSWQAFAPGLAGTGREDERRRQPWVPNEGSLFIEAVALLEALALDQPLILVFDDVHFCDRPTRDLLRFVSSRDETTRLLLVVTECGWRSRQGGDRDRAHDRADAQGGNWRRLDLGPLSERSVERYLHLRCPDIEPCPAVGEGLRKRSAGHPLLLEGLVGEISEEGAGEAPLSDAPVAFRRRLDDELGILDPGERVILRSASIAATRAFSSAAVACLLDQDLLTTEEQFEDLASRGVWIERAGARRWPDGTVAETFRFQLLIYRDYLYHTLPVANRRDAHVRHGRRLEAAYQEAASRIVANLVYHFETGGDAERAARYRQLASRRFPCKRGSPGELQPRAHLERVEPRKLRAWEPRSGRSQPSQTAFHRRDETCSTRWKDG